MACCQNNSLLEWADGVRRSRSPEYVAPSGALYLFGFGFYKYFAPPALRIYQFDLGNMPSPRLLKVLIAFNDLAFPTAILFGCTALS